MPASPETDAPHSSIAIAAQVLYLVNLLLLPGLAFIALVVLYRMQGNGPDQLARLHLRQALSASLWAGILLVAANGLILLLGGYDGPWVWMVVILYFTIAHSTLIILGMIGLIKAMAGQVWSYPLIGSLLK